MSAAAVSAHVCTTCKAAVCVVPRPPIVGEGEHSAQRRYGSNRRDAFGMRIARETDAELVVFRMAREETASLEMRIGNRHGSTLASIELDLNRTELLELAARLIDAAHDISAHPSEQLMAEREAARGAV